jgi:hypothetical protein
VDIGAFEVVTSYTTVVNSVGDGTANAVLCAPGNANTCRLRDAVAVVNGNLAGATPTIKFDATVFPANSAKTIVLDATAGTLTLSHDVSIDGTNQQVVVDGGCTGCDPGGTPSGGVTVFQVNGGVTATLTALTIQHGNGPGSSLGGGILNIGGALTLTNLILRENVSGFGGGHFSELGTVNATNVTVADNTARIGGGGIDNDVGSTLTLTNSTVVARSWATAARAGTAAASTVSTGRRR